MQPHWALNFSGFPGDICAFSRGYTVSPAPMHNFALVFPILVPVALGGSSKITWNTNCENGEREMRPEKAFPVAYKLWSRQMWPFVSTGRMPPRAWECTLKRREGISRRNA